MRILTRLLENKRNEQWNIDDLVLEDNLVAWKLEDTLAWVAEDTLAAWVAGDTLTDTKQKE